MSYEARIAALLAKAERTTPAEAEALTAKAVELMVKYGIDRAMLDARTTAGGSTASEPIIEVEVVCAGVYARQLSVITNRVAVGMGTCRHWWQLRAGQMVGHVVGYASDARAAAILASSLHLQAITAMRAWWNGLVASERAGITGGKSSQALRARQDFLVAFAIAVGNRLDAARARAAHDAGTGTDVVLRERGDLVQDWLDDEHPDLRDTRPVTVRHTAAVRAGAAAGERADVGHGRIGGVRAVEGSAA